MEPEHAVFSREEKSPDGAWLIQYAYVDGERSPQIVEPRVTELATGRVVLDFWRGCLSGQVGPFTVDGFHLRVSDPYGPATIEVTVDTRTETFLIPGEAIGPRRLADLGEALTPMVERARREWHTQHPPAPPPRVPTLAARIKRFFKS
jgi:hypothetical protein